MSDPTVYVVDDDEAVRQMLCWLVTSVKLPVVEYKSGDDFFDLWNRAMVGCIILDVRMPGMSGLELQRKLNRQEVSLPIIIITGHADVPMAIEAMKNGAFYFIEKPFNNQELLDIVQKAIEESVRRAEMKSQNGKRFKILASLTERERQVLEILVKGETNKVIARNMSISQKIVETHRAKIMKNCRPNPWRT